MSGDINGPRTPARDRAKSWSDPDDNPPSTDSSKTAAFTTDNEGDPVAPPHPFLAYARRVRSFASPLKINKSRYLLTFVDEETAHEWWMLMQEEYPDSVRESPQLFSFKSDKIPAKAWDNPRFVHLKQRWTYRQLEANPMEKQQNGVNAPSKRASLGRMLSTPSLRTIGEIPPAPETNGRVEDPFTAKPDPPQPGVDLVELNRTLDRIQMMMNQTNLRINALAERQATYAETLDRLQAAIEGNANSVQALTTQHQAGAISTRNMRSSVEQNASHIKVLLESHGHGVNATERMQKSIEDASLRIDEIANHQRASEQDSQTTKTTVERTAEQIQSLLDHQRTADQKLDTIQSALTQLAADKQAPTPRTPTPTPSAGSMQKLQAAVEQQTAQLASMAADQKSGGKSMKKTHATLDQVVADQKELIESVQQIRASHEQQAAIQKQQTAKINARLDSQSAALEAQTARTQSTAADNQKAMMSMCAKILQAVESRPPVMACDHEVIPPPKKMNRTVIGYVYSK